MFDELRPHLKELRKRLGISLAVVFIMFFVCFSFWEPLLAWMIHPLNGVLPEGSHVIFTKVQEPFFTALKVSFFFMKKKKGWLYLLYFLQHLCFSQVLHFAIM